MHACTKSFILMRYAGTKLRPKCFHVNLSARDTPRSRRVHVELFSEVAWRGQALTLTKGQSIQFR